MGTLAVRIRRHSLRAGAFESRGSVVTIGAYDGLHIGHQAILKRVLDISREQDLAAVVMSFEPTPKEFFARSHVPTRLMSFRQRALWLDAAGLDGFLCPRFDARLAAETADDFVRHWLRTVLAARVVVVGDDFRYGRDREGTYTTLQRAGSRYGFAVERTPSIRLAGQRVSSTAIRKALLAGDLSKANHHLGRAFAIDGRVIHGQKLGRTLGFPTANIALDQRLCPLHGIYAVRVSGSGLDEHPGVASVGTRPTVTEAGQVLLEVHLLDYSGNLYGQRLNVALHHFIREEQKFASVDQLVAQMRNDRAKAEMLITT